MTRRRQEQKSFDELYELLLVVPSWVGPLLALLGFLVLRFVMPSLLDQGGEHPGAGTAFGGMARGFAAPAAIVVLFLWVAAEAQKRRRRRLLDGQSGLASIRSLSWQEFEHLAGEAYCRQGYVVQETGRTSGDGGIDLWLRRGDERVVVQCKRWRTYRVGVKPVRELYGVMTSERASRGVLITSGSFTREALRFADGKPLDLVAGPALWELVQSVRAVGHGLHSASPGAPIPRPASAQPTAPIEAPRPANARFTPDTAVECPLCRAPMVLRTARRGKHAGGQFWGCTRYPNCKGIVNNGVPNP